MTSPCDDAIQYPTGGQAENRLAALATERRELEARLEKVMEALAGFSPAAMERARRLPRGGLMKSILRILKRAPSKGISVKAIAATLKRKPAAIHVWFYTTGRDLPQIRKAGRGVYAWSDSGN